MTQARPQLPLNRKKTLTSYAEIKDIIGQILFGENLEHILQVILIHIEAKLPKARASICLYDQKSSSFIPGAAPNLPKNFCEKIQKISSELSFGVTDFSRTAMMVRDTQTDPLWRAYSDLAKEYKIRSCWSIPIMNVEGELLGRFALYYARTHKPTQKETILVKELIDIICLAIERDRSLALKKQSEEEIQIQRTNALNSLKHAYLGEMAKNISHEVNSPLAVILGSVHQMNRIIESEGANTEKLKIYTARLDRSVNRIEKIIKGLRSITREASNDPFVKVSARSVIDDALSIFQERFLSSNIKLVVSGEVEVLFECRSTQISQILVNVLNNSYEAISKSENAWIQINVSHHGEKVKFEITDSGFGIPLPIVEKIMIPLFTTKLLSRATGLGLSVSQALIQEHSGKIWYDKSCQHTRFVIELPKVQMPSLKQAA